VLTGLMGIIAFTNLPGMQLRIMSLADDAPSIASGANIAALNIGNALGVWIGGLVITTSLGYTGPIWVGAAFAALAFVVLLATLKSPKAKRIHETQTADTEKLPAGH